LNNWRLPTISELLIIADHGQKNPAIDSTYFTNTGSEGDDRAYWSSTISPEYADYFLTVFFDYGWVNTYTQSFEAYRARCVHE